MPQGCATRFSFVVARWPTLEPGVTTRLPSVNIVFVEPAFPNNQRRFVAALAGVGAGVIGVGESPESALGDELRSRQLTLRLVIPPATSISRMLTSTGLDRVCPSYPTLAEAVSA